MDERDLSIIAQNAGTTAAALYRHITPAETGGFDDELFESIRQSLFQGVVSLVGQNLVQTSFPGAQVVQAPPVPTNVTQTPAYQAAGGPPAATQPYGPPPVPPPPPPAGPAGGPPQGPACPNCGGPMKEQRNKRNPKAPDWKCQAGGWDRDRQQEWGCQGAVWNNSNYGGR